MLRTIIIDDEPDGVRTLELLLQMLMPGIKIIGTTINAVEGVEMINNYCPDVVFLDINMPVLDGFSLLDHLSFKKFALIFTTAHQQFGLRALKQDATDYLLKPINVDELRMAIQRAKERLNGDPMQFNVSRVLSDIRSYYQSRILIPHKSYMEYAEPASILYLEACLNSSKVTLLNERSIVASKSLKEYEVILCRNDHTFIRIHNSFIINIHHVCRFLRDGYVVMPDKKIIPVSKSKKETFLKAINFTP